MLASNERCCTLFPCHYEQVVLHVLKEWRIWLISFLYWCFAWNTLCCLALCLLQYAVFCTVKEWDMLDPARIREKRQEQPFSFSLPIAWVYYLPVDSFCSQSIRVFWNLDSIFDVSIFYFVHIIGQMTLELLKLAPYLSFHLWFEQPYIKHFRPQLFTTLSIL